MKIFMVLLLTVSSLAFCQQRRELAHIQVHEWGLLTMSGGTPVFSSTPGEASPELALPVEPDHGMVLRAPVLYFHGPAFTGTVTVKTNNGSIFDIYPSVPDADRNHNHCSWTCDFVYDAIHEFPNYRGMAPGEWNYELWRTENALSITREDGWADKFLYYETAPATTDFLPYRAGMESLCEEYMEIQALVIRREGHETNYSLCTLRDVVYGYGEDVETHEVTADDILDVFYSWSIDLIDFDEVDAMWNTWSSWVLEDHLNDSAYSNGLVLYMIPAELTNQLSVISVTPEETAYPVDISRYLIVAMPL